MAGFRVKNQRNAQPSFFDHEFLHDVAQRHIRRDGQLNGTKSAQPAAKNRRGLGCIKYSVRIGDVLEVRQGTQLRHFFFQRHAREQIRHALRHRQTGVAIRCIRRRRVGGKTKLRADDARPTKNRYAAD